MGKIGMISVIPKDYDGAFPTMEKSLRQRGYSRGPGTAKMMFPYRELSGKYRTGLDENAKSILKLTDDNLRKLEQKRVKELRVKLEELTGVDLSPTSEYYNHSSKRPGVHVQVVSLADGDNIFNLDDPWQYITYLWLSADPRIAASLSAYERGEYPHDTQYYVKDEEVESAVMYKKKKTANDAIVKFNSWSLEKRLKIARLLDLPVGDNSREETVYNLTDNFLKSSQVERGVHQGKDPLKVFGLYADLKDDLLYTKDLVEQAFAHHIYKERKGGRIYEGELEVFRDKQELIDHLLDENNQEDLLELEKKLKVKKLAQA